MARVSYYRAADLSLSYIHTGMSAWLAADKNSFKIFCVDGSLRYDQSVASVLPDLSSANRLMETRYSFC